MVRVLRDMSGEGTGGGGGFHCLLSIVAFYEGDFMEQELIQIFEMLVAFVAAYWQYK